MMFIPNVMTTRELHLAHVIDGLRECETLPPDTVQWLALQCGLSKGNPRLLEPAIRQKVQELAAANEIHPHDSAFGEKIADVLRKSLSA